MIQVNNLRKIYGNVIAVDKISFKVEKGETFALLGPNGAGKTTTIKAILGLINYEGEIRIDGMDAHCKEVKKYIGYLPETVSFYDNLTALQNMYFFAELKGVEKEKCLGLLKEVGLGGDANRKVGGFSKGMLQRLNLAQCMLGDPKLLILDEPTSGLDALGAWEIRNKIKELKKKGVTILLCSHILSEVQEVSDRVAILNRGKIIAIDSVENLSKKLDIQPKLKIKLAEMKENILDYVKKIDGVKNAKIVENFLEITCNEEAKANIINEIGKTAKIIDFKTIEPSLEEIFIRMVKKDE